jgi:hypothetical protein
MRYVCAVATTLVFFGCSKPEELANPRDKAAVSDIHETVFRHQFRKNSSAIQQKAKAYFLSIDEEDPKADFLKRFENEQPPVLAG